MAVTWAEIREMPVSRRVEGLHARFQERYRELGQRVYREEADVRARDAALLRAYRIAPGDPAIVRRARALAEFAEAMPIRVHPEDLLVGHQTFNGPVPAELRELGYAATTGHIVHDYASLLERGAGHLRGLAAAARIATGEQATNLAAFDAAMEAFIRFVVRHAEASEALADTLSGEAASEWCRRADDLRHIAVARPESFAQAVQLLWLAHLFLHAENPSVAISFGRIDQILWPFLRRDLEEGRTTLEGAFELVCAFLIKCCEGEESQNAVLGGVDAEGRDATNPLSLLFLAAMRRLATFQPSLSVRIHPGSPEDFVEAACELAAAGTGNPGFMNDPVVIAALQALEIPLERARDWGIVGCYEATPQGDAYPNTVLCRLSLVDSLAAYLATPEARTAPDFEGFLSGWYAHVARTYARELAGCQARWNGMRDHAPSPFGSVLMRGCVERGLPLEAGGAGYSLAGVNILGLGTVVDSLHAVRTLVYDRRELTLAEVADAVAADFPDEALRLRLRSLPGRYGTDGDETNALAREVSSVVARMVLESRLEGGVRPYPGFFAFAADIYALTTATPDGRHKSDLISYGCAPCSSVEAGPTAVMASAAHAAHALCACGNPLAITLQRSDVQGPEGIALIRSLVEGYFARGGFHVHFNVASADDLRRAKADPENHRNLTVRVSGYSARFVTVDPKWQDALIERAERGR